MQTPEERKAANEAAFRDANARLEAGARELVADVDESLVPFLCECALRSCSQVVLLTLTEYRQVRAHESRALTVHGHEDPTIEDVVDRTDRYVVTEKFGRAREVFVAEEEGNP
jgi:hypothetical protein